MNIDVGSYNLILVGENREKEKWISISNYEDLSNRNKDA